MNSEFRPITSKHDRSSFPAQSSVLDENAIRDRVLPDYQIPPVIHCRFFERGDSDIYRVATNAEDFYLKIYRPPHTLLRAETEARFVSALHAAHAPVVKPVPCHDRRFAIEIGAGEGPRPCLLFEQAPPSMPSPFNEERAYQFGVSVASLHQKADSLAQEFSLPQVTFSDTAEEQLRHARPFLGDTDYKYLLGLGRRFYPLLSELTGQSANYGLCHGDLVHSNLRYSTQGQITFFYFGAACYSFRSYELSLCLRTVRANEEEFVSARQDAFLRGYASVRPLMAELSDYLPLYAIYRHLKWMGRATATCPLRMGEEMITGFLPGAIASAHQLEKDADR